MTNTRVQHFINGEYAEGTSGKTFENRCPIDNSLISHVCEASRADVDAAVRAARAALSGPWGKMTIAERTNILYAVAAGIEHRFKEFLAAEMADTGKPITLASHLDIPRGAANFRIFADVVKNVPGEYFETPAPDGTARKFTSGARGDLWSLLSYQSIRRRRRGGPYGERYTLRISDDNLDAKCRTSKSCRSPGPCWAGMD